VADERSVLEQEEQAERGEGQEEGQRGQFLEAVPHPVEQCRDCSGQGRGRLLLRALRRLVSNAEVGQPAGDRVLGRGQVGAQSVELAADPGQDEDDHREGDHDQAHEHQRRAEAAGEPAPL